MTVDAWKASGLCTQTDPDLFFDDTPDGVKEAKKLCASCEVREPHCLADALLNGSGHGVQAGLTGEEREAHPDFVRAQPVSTFAPATDDELRHRWEANEARLARRAAAEARRRNLIPFDQLEHPLDRKASK